MTIIATTELTDCLFICGATTAKRIPDKCVAIAGVIGDSDLTIMTYCIPSTPGAGVRRSVRDDGVWTAEGTLPIMNKIINILFTDFQRGERLVLISETEDGAGSTLKTRIDVISKGGGSWIPGVTPRLVSSTTILEIVSGSIITNSRVVLHQIVDIQVMPEGGGLATVLFVQLQGMEIADPDSISEHMIDRSYTMCGALNHQSWNPSMCHSGIWDETERGHIIWLNGTTTEKYFAVVPGGSALSTSSGNIRVMRISGVNMIPQEIKSLPFKSTSWSLTSGIPTTTRQLDFSLTTRALVRKAAKVSQAGIETGNFEKIGVFMTNDPISPTHWLSEVRVIHPISPTLFLPRMRVQPLVLHHFFPGWSYTPRGWLQGNVSHSPADNA